jgi:4-oxalocrotonate tautomerase
MPIVVVKMAKGRSIEQKRKLVKAITDVFERENWATGGQLHIDKFGKGFGKLGQSQCQ